MPPLITPLPVVQRLRAGLLLVLLLGVSSALAAPPTAPSDLLTDPNLPQTADAPVSFSLKPDGPGRTLEITFPVRKFAANLTYSVEGATTLSPADWAPIWTNTDGFAALPVVGAIDLADRTVVTIRDTAANPAATTRFLRVVLQ